MTATLPLLARLTAAAASYAQPAAPASESGDNARPLACADDPGPADRPRDDGPSGEG